MAEVDRIVARIAELNARRGAILEEAEKIFAGNHPDARGEKRLLLMNGSLFSQAQLRELEEVDFNIRSLNSALATVNQSVARKRRAEEPREPDTTKIH